MRDAADAGLFCRAIVAGVIDVEVGPDKLVVEGLHGFAGINVLLHRLARRAPGGGENQNDRLALFFSRTESGASGGFEFRAAFGEIAGESGDRDGGEEEGEELFHGRWC